jgi:hypothetical protein
MEMGNGSYLRVRRSNEQMSHFIPCLKSLSAPDFARLFVSHVVRLYRLPDSIVSDRSYIFPSYFWSTLATILKIDPRKTTTVKQCEQIKPSKRLHRSRTGRLAQLAKLPPLAEFQFNNTLNESTLMSPFNAS